MVKKKKRYCCLFTRTENVHLIKDVGMIPYILTKYYSIDGRVATYDNGPYEYIDTEVNGLGMDIITKFFGNSKIDSIIYLFKKSREIDILQIFHPNLNSAMQGFLYKILNKSGKVYLKLDCTLDYIQNSKGAFPPKGLKGNILFYMLRNKIDLITGETTGICNYLNDNFGLKVKYIPNGFFDDNIHNPYKTIEKENIIITVGRIGTLEKDNKTLLKSFSNIKNQIPNWKLRIIGPIEEEFKIYIKAYFDENPDLIDRVIFTGLISNRDELDAEYKKAKIFCLTSISEGFPLVFTEAMKNGNYIISTDIDSAKDIIKDTEYGQIFSKKNITQLSEILLNVCSIDNNNMDNYSNKIIERAYNEFNWINICEKILKNF